MLFGSLPKNVSAIVLDEPANNLTCQVRNWEFPEKRGKAWRGVISWQCVRALQSATDVSDLCRRMNALAASDAKSVKSPRYRYHTIGASDFGKLGSR